jgi:hypothetical protein
VAPTDRAPYPGLRSFRREETDLFFGRDDCVEAMVARLAATRFLAVLGSSGTGKSSLVKTGLLSGLEMGLLDGAGSRWRVVDFRPGGAPLRNLARRLIETEHPDAEDAAVTDMEVDLLLARLKRGPRALIEWCRDGHHLAPGTNLLLLVDQFEELFRYQDYAGREEAEAFVALLLESRHPTEAADPQEAEFPIYVTITMRSEYLGACALIEGLAEAINEGTYLTPRMTREECREAIVGPARVCEVEIEPALVNRLLNDLANFAPWDTSGTEIQLDRQARRADQLPLLQYTLNRMWEEAKEKTRPITLTVNDYTAIGGLSGALDKHANAIVEGLKHDLGPGRGPAVTGAVFRALTLGNSVADAVRRPTRFGDLVAICGDDRAGVTAVVDAFRAPGCNFLTPEVDPRHPALADNDNIDISHESLIRQWAALSQWLENEARIAHEWRRLEEDAARGELLSGQRLALAVAAHEGMAGDGAADAGEIGPNAAWARRYGIDFDRVNKFIAESVRAQEERTAAEKAAEAEHQRVETERMRAESARRWWRYAFAAVAVMVFVVGGLAAYAYREAKTNRHYRDVMVEQAVTLESLLDTLVKDMAFNSNAMTHMRMSKQEESSDQAAKGSADQNRLRAAEADVAAAQAALTEARGIERRSADELNEGRITHAQHDAALRDVRFAQDKLASAQANLNFTRDQVKTAAAFRDKWGPLWWYARGSASMLDDIRARDPNGYWRSIRLMRAHLASLATIAALRDDPESNAAKAGYRKAIEIAQALARSDMDLDSTDKAHNAIWILAVIVENVNDRELAAATHALSLDVMNKSLAKNPPIPADDAARHSQYIGSEMLRYGTFLHRMGEVDPAIETLRSGLDRATAATSHRIYVNLPEELAGQLQERANKSSDKEAARRDWDEAAHYFTVAIERLDQTFTDEFKRAFARAAKDETFIVGLDHDLQALAAAERADDWNHWLDKDWLHRAKRRAGFYAKLGDIYWDLEKWNEARASYALELRLHLALMARDDDAAHEKQYDNESATYDVSAALRHLASLERRMGHPAIAVHFLTECIDLLRERAERDDSLTRIQGALGFCYRDRAQNDVTLKNLTLAREDYTRAAGHYERAAKNPQLDLIPHWHTLTLHSLAGVALDLDGPDAAAAWEDKAIEVAERSYQKKQTAETIDDLSLDYAVGSWYHLMNRKPDVAKAYALKAYAIRQETWATDKWSENLIGSVNLAHAHLFNGEFEEAKKIYLFLRTRPCGKETCAHFIKEDFAALRDLKYTHPGMCHIGKEIGDEAYAGVACPPLGFETAGEGHPAR